MPVETLEELSVLFPEPDRLTHIDAVRWLHEEAVKVGSGGLCVEVGSWCGWTATAMALGGPTVLCVDTFRASDRWVWLEPQLARIGGRRDGTLDRYLVNARRAGLLDRLVPIIAQSLVVAAAMGDSTADLVFLDGDHSRAAVAADIIAWGRIVRPGKILCGDNWGIGEVSETALLVLAGMGWPPPQETARQMWFTTRPQDR